MDLNLDELDFLYNAVNSQAKAGFTDGIIGAQKALGIALKLRNEGENISNPRVEPEKVPEKASRKVPSKKPKKDQASKTK